MTYEVYAYAPWSFVVEIAVQTEGAEMAFEFFA
jgi:hypothetical protein